MIRAFDWNVMGTRFFKDPQQFEWDLWNAAFTPGPP